ncbi:DUF4915 domain-containing protein [Solirubrobacter sp. CPCC 204708]|uniref:TIGR03032 family protein n=1 Tax=Solirubrobacter deserti TaxID=2282478 RepID=A0ABT4RN64_9ACTN|nr:DUF4915 domain-containing protein [Solirubrobacter deserti]MBE2317428.1 DUF4915 domain-containing protein [Solirubrobacter deserti]MDA0140010.1 TIGR03032 family protein [Solirubrobacter deserti]
MTPTATELEPRWAEHGAAWRDPAEVVSGWEGIGSVDPDLLKSRADRAFWELLDRLELTLIVTREYEHLVVALSVEEGKPVQSHLRLPHPSGLAVDHERGIVHVAATRNPNQIFDLEPVCGALPRADMPYPGELTGRPLLPARSRFLPGALYIHDLALVGGKLHANSVGQNAVVELLEHGGHRLAWWPGSVEREGKPDIGRNYLQLNSIAAGPDLEGSFFSASQAAPSQRRPGHKNWPVDGRGVIFSGATREPVASGLTRPHSARLHEGAVWVDNSGYGELCRLEGEQFTTVAQLPGWTRGLAFAEGIAFVASSRVIPRFRQYAPGLDVDRSVCGLHAVDLASGQIVGSVRWPYGNQIFAVEALPRDFTLGFPFRSARPAPDRTRRLFYAFDFQGEQR